MFSISIYVSYITYKKSPIPCPSRLLTRIWIAPVSEGRSGKTRLKLLRRVYHLSNVVSSDRRNYADPETLCLIPVTPPQESAHQYPPHNPHAAPPLHPYPDHRPLLFLHHLDPLQPRPKDPLLAHTSPHPARHIHLSSPADPSITIPVSTTLKKVLTAWCFERNVMTPEGSTL